MKVQTRPGEATVAFDPTDPPQRRRNVEHLLQAVASNARVADALTEVTQVPGPGMLRALAHRENRWRAIEATWGLRTSTQVARAAGSTAKNPAQYVRDLARKTPLLAVERAGRRYYPGFLFDEDGRPRREYAPVLRVFADADWAPESVLFWLTAPNGRLPGEARPVDVITGDPEAVLDAARATIDRP